MHILENIKVFLIANILQLIILLTTISSCLLISYNILTKEVEVVTEIKEVIVEKPVEEVKNIIKVDIKGHIKNPGVYEMYEGEIINNLINKAGGLTKYGTTTNINLSKKLSDEMVIIVYSLYELKQKEVEEEVSCTSYELDNCNASTITTDNQEEKASAKVSINNGTKEELMTLPGIGESKATAIIEYRESTPFETLEDLKNVSGIGDSTFDTLKENITL